VFGERKSKESKQIEQIEQSGDYSDGIEVARLRFEFGEKADAELNEADRSGAPRSFT